MAYICPHRRGSPPPGESYSMVRTWVEFTMFGRPRSLSFFGVLKQCDSCQKLFVRWPWWEPPE